jgi:hypothetical protein
MRKKATDSAVKISAAATQKTVCSRSRRRFLRRAALREMSGVSTQATFSRGTAGVFSESSRESSCSVMAYRLLFP